MIDISQYYPLSNVARENKIFHVSILSYSLHHDYMITIKRPPLRSRCNYFNFERNNNCIDVFSLHVNF